MGRGSTVGNVRGRGSGNGRGRRGSRGRGGNCGYPRDQHTSVVNDPVIDAYTTAFRKLLSVELEAEKQFYLNLWNRPVSILESEGVCVFGLRMSMTSSQLGGLGSGSDELNLLLGYPNKQMLPHQLNLEVGDYLRVLGSPTKPTNKAPPCIFGELVHRGGKMITLSVNFIESRNSCDLDNIFELTKTHSWRLDRGFSKITFNRMEAALAELRPLKMSQISFPLKYIVSSYLFQTDMNNFPAPQGNSSSLPILDTHISAALDLLDMDLNSSQVDAIQVCLRYRVGLIQGPPGTGKTSTASALIFALNTLVKPTTGVIGVFAFNNVATDQLLLRCLDLKMYCIRVGSNSESDPRLSQCDLTVLIRVRCEKDFATIAKLDAQTSELSLELKQLGYRQSELYSRKKRNLGKRQLGEVNREIIDLMAEKESIKIRMGKLISKKKKMRQRIDKEKRNLLLEADVVFSTCIRGGHTDLTHMEFAAIVVDECTQAVEPSCVIPLLRLSEATAASTVLKHARVILLGDHKQLPPMVRSQQGNEELALALLHEPESIIEFPRTLLLSMFERLIRIRTLNNTPVTVGRCTLQIQYRMHSKILHWPNHQFYSGNIKSGCKDIDRSLPTGILKMFTAVGVDLMKSPVLLIDIDDFPGAEECRVHTSWTNPVCAVIVSHFVDSLLQESGGMFNASDVGVITPYSAQQKLLLSSDNGLARGVEVRTVDGFQGREKEVIILDTVRNNKHSMIGFLEDEKRLNVAITRARRLTVFVGSVSTLATSPMWKGLLEYIGSEGGILAAERLQFA